ncbi:MAG: hypothetical protein LBE49_04720 [Deltaproteobacteria bacterium]|nr:hypothetical protein [Deltaproteobacteria bacterium]
MKTIAVSLIAALMISLAIPALANAADRGRGPGHRRLTVNQDDQRRRPRQNVQRQERRHNGGPSMNAHRRPGPGAGRDRGHIRPGGPGRGGPGHNGRGYAPRSGRRHDRSAYHAPARRHGRRHVGPPPRRHYRHRREVVYVQQAPSYSCGSSSSGVSFGVNLPNGGSFGIDTSGGGLSFGITLPGF